MPYKSKAQQRKFNVDPTLKKKYAAKWNKETKESKKGFKGLPNKVKKKKTSRKKKK